MPENIPYGKPWHEVEEGLTVPKAVKTIRGNWNVPRERFHVTASGLYRMVQPL